MGRSENIGEKVTVTLSKLNKQRLDELVEKKGMTKTAIVSLALDEYFRRERQNE
jgi:predicted transcriptional regulator